MLCESIEFLIQQCMTKIPSLALVSGRFDHSSGDLTPINSQEQILSYSHLLWSLWRLGVRHLVALPHDWEQLQKARHQLTNPPPLPHYKDPFLQQLIKHQRQALRADPFSQMGWSDQILITPPPTSPLQFDGVQLCFHDELIGVEDAFLIHYGPSRFEVSGYHSPMSSLSVPLGDELSALLLFRVSRPTEPSSNSLKYPLISASPSQINQKTSVSAVSLSEVNETGVVQINAQGKLIKGPWWPKLKL